MASTYSSESLQVLSGLEPVRLRPGMYTDTARPNHLVQEVVDNSVDEALAGFARDIEVTLCADGSVIVIDDGRGMPVDKHPEHGLTGVELILTKLHAGAKFDDEAYSFSGGLHGVGVSVVNALSAWLEVEVKRDGWLHRQRYENGDPVTALKPVASVGKRNTGTRIHFLPNAEYFDSANLAKGRLKHLLRAKAVLCPGLSVSLTVEGAAVESQRWFYEDGLVGYLNQALEGAESVPAEPFTHGAKGNEAAAEWALKWLPDGGGQNRAIPVTEAYVNLIPTPQGGTHVNGLRSGLIEALKEFCEFRDLTPRGLKLTGDDLWEQCAYVLSAKLKDPQFSGQPRSGCRRAAPASSSAASPRTPSACGSTSTPRTASASPNWPSPTPRSGPAPPRRWCARRSPPARRCRASWPTARLRTRTARSSSWWRATPPAAPPSRRATGSSRR